MNDTLVLAWVIFYGGIVLVAMVASASFLGWLHRPDQEDDSEET